MSRADQMSRRASESITVRLSRPQHFVGKGWTGRFSACLVYHEYYRVLALSRHVSPLLGHQAAGPHPPQPSSASLGAVGVLML